MRLVSFKLASALEKADIVVQPVIDNLGYNRITYRIEQSNDWLIQSPILENVRDYLESKYGVIIDIENMSATKSTLIIGKKLNYRKDNINTKKDFPNIPKKDIVKLDDILHQIIKRKLYL